MGEIKAEGKGRLVGVVVINSIRERKEPRAYIVINPYNGRIIFISQFYIFHILFLCIAVSVLFVVVCCPHYSFFFFFPMNL